MANKPPKIKQVSETRTTRYNEVDRNEPSLLQMIREYLDGDLTHEEDLKRNEYTIKVYRVENGRSLQLGARFNNLDSVTNDVGEMFGDGNYELFINWKTPEGEKSFTKYLFSAGGYGEVESDGPEGPTNVVARPAPNQNDQLIAILLQQNNQTQTLVLKLIETMGTIKTGGGGASASDIIAAIQTGAQLAGGAAPAGGGPDIGTQLLMNLPALMEMVKNKPGAQRIVEPRPEDPNTTVIPGGNGQTKVPV